MSDKMEACQWCGVVPQIYEDTVDGVGWIAVEGGYYIGGHDPSCRIHITGYFPTKNIAIQYWNKAGVKK